MNKPSAQIFRQEAVEHYLHVEDGKGLARISPPWSWSLLWTVVVIVLVALTFSVVGNVEVNGRARGILRPGSIRNLVAQTSGTVTEVLEHSGQAVRGGSLMLKIDSTSVRSQLLEAQRQVDVIETDFTAVAHRQDSTYELQVSQLQQRLAMLREQVKSQNGSLQIYERKLHANQVLEEDGLVSTIAVDEAKEALYQAQRQLNASRQSLVQTQQELTSLQGRRQDELWQQEQARKTAQAKVEAIGVNVGIGIIRAPEDGVVEAILVKPGDAVQAGQVVGKLVPKGDPMQVVAFLSEKDRAFVKTGEMARLELDQLPYSEYGTLNAKVLRISDDLADPFEIQEALGPSAKADSSVYRVDLQVMEDSAVQRAGVRLRTGMLLYARFNLRRQRPITLVLDPLKRWFK